MIDIKMIWSTDPNGYIGHNNELLFKDKQDLANFKKLTIGEGFNCVVMGRKTFESIGSKPLPNRLNVVLTKDRNYYPDEDVLILHSVREVLQYCEQEGFDTLWVIGGEKIYEQFLELSNDLYVSHFNENGVDEPNSSTAMFNPYIEQDFYLVNEFEFDNFTLKHWRR